MPSEQKGWSPGKAAVADIDLGHHITARQQQTTKPWQQPGQNCGLQVECSITTTSSSSRRTGQLRLSFSESTSHARYFFVSSYFCCKDSPLLNYLRSCIWGWYVKSFVTRSSSDGADTCFFTSELSVIISQSFHIHECSKLSTQYHHSHSQHQTLSSHLSPHL